MPFAIAGTLLGLGAILLEAANRVFGTYLRTPIRALVRALLVLAVFLAYAVPALVWVVNPDNATAGVLLVATGIAGPVLLCVYLWPPRFGIRRVHDVDEDVKPLPPDAQLRTLRLAPTAWPVDAPQLRVLALSDLHCNTPEQVDEVDARARDACAEPPDLVLVPGDLGEVEDLLPRVLAMLAALPSRHGTFLVLGNHDLEEGRDELIPELARQAGVHLLRNETHELPQAGIAVAGLEVPWQGEEPPAPDTDLPLLGLAHTPDAAFALARLGVRVAVCGHTHGGMLRPPLVGPLGVPSRLGRALAYGVFRKDDTHIVVTSGACRPLPHTSEKPEIVVLELSPSRKDDIPRPPGVACPSAVHGTPQSP